MGTIKKEKKIVQGELLLSSCNPIIIETDYDGTIYIYKGVYK